MSMFKISTVDTRSQRTLVVEGALIGPWISELRSAWRTASRSLGGRKLRIDLRSLTVISREGEEAVFDLMKQGAKFSCGGICTKYMVKRLARECQDELQAASRTYMETEKALRR
jgi:hypothetical protein